MAAENAKKSALLRLIECPACLDHFTGSILLCRNGHSVCGMCRRSLRNCPVCRVAFTVIRNYALESLVEQMEYPCRYAQHGCDEYLWRENKVQHEKNCGYRTFKCRIIAADGKDCTWICRAGEMYEHAIKEHAASAWMQENNLDRWKPNNDPDKEVQLIRAHGEIFYLTRQAQNDNMYWCLSYIGPDDNAQTYSLLVEMPGDSRSRRSARIVDICQTFDTSPKKLIADGMCLGLSNKMIQSFKTELRGIWYKVQVGLDQTTSDDDSPGASTTEICESTD